MKTEEFKERKFSNKREKQGKYRDEKDYIREKKHLRQ